MLLSYYMLSTIFLKFDSEICISKFYFRFPINSHKNVASVYLFQQIYRVIMTTYEQLPTVYAFQISSYQID